MIANKDVIDYKHVAQLYVPQDCALPFPHVLRSLEETCSVLLNQLIDCKVPEVLRSQRLLFGMSVNSPTRTYAQYSLLQAIEWRELPDAPMTVAAAKYSNPRPMRGGSNVNKSIGSAASYLVRRTTTSVPQHHVEMIYTFVELLRPPSSCNSSAVL